MAKIELHPDFKDFLKLLHSHNVEYLIVGGYHPLQLFQL